VINYLTTDTISVFYWQSNTVLCIRPPTLLSSDTRCRAARHIREAVSERPAVPIFRLQIY